MAVSLALAVVAALSIAVYLVECAAAERCLASHLTARAGNSGGMVRYEELPAHLVSAIVSVEDPGFFDCVREGGCADSWHLTQRVARECIGDSNKTPARMIQEAMLAWALEHRATKKEIFEIYANQVFLGRVADIDVRGVGEGARAYFGKDVRNLGVAESALLAGLIANPTRLDPYRETAKAEKRRNQVLRIMVADGLIDSTIGEAASKDPLGIVSAH